MWMGADNAFRLFRASENKLTYILLYMNRCRLSKFWIFHQGYTRTRCVGGRVEFRWQSGE